MDTSHLFTAAPAVAVSLEGRVRGFQGCGGGQARAAHCNRFRGGLALLLSRARGEDGSPSRGRGRAAGSRSCSRRGRRRWRACQKKQETPPRHPTHHRTGLLQRQARGVRQQDQGHHPHGLRLPPRHQPHRPDHAPMQRTRHPTTTTHNLTHKNSRSLSSIQLFVRTPTRF